jgi:hypothetical protein
LNGPFIIGEILQRTHARSATARPNAEGNQRIAAGSRLASSDAWKSRDFREPVMCPFYRTSPVTVERRRKARESGPAQPPVAAAPWCAHLYSPVTKYIATVIVGGADRLRCAGNLARCQVQASVRPRS